MLGYPTGSRLKASLGRVAAPQLLQQSAPLRPYLHARHALIAVPAAYCLPPERPSSLACSPAPCDPAAAPAHTLIPNPQRSIGDYAPGVYLP
eukprot:8885292-Pyramimonas_sp.AAC.1